MLVNRTNVAEVFKNLNASFNQAFDAAQAGVTWGAIATEQSTNALVEQFDWISELPNWREWTGDRHIQALSAYAYTLALAPYEVSFAVKRRDLEADRLGIYATKARSAGELAAYYPEERVYDALNAGFTAMCYDGKAFFATDHPALAKTGAKTTFSNKLTAALSAATLAGAQASFGAAKTALTKMVNSQGRPIRVRDLVLTVPAALEDTARLLMAVERIEDGKPNPYRGVAMVNVSQDLTSDTAWFLSGTAGGLKPIIHVVRKRPTQSEVTDPNDSYVFRTGEFLFGQDADSAAGYTFPQLAVGSTGAG